MKDKRFEQEFDAKVTDALRQQVSQVEVSPEVRQNIFADIQNIQRGVHTTMKPVKKNKKFIIAAVAAFALTCTTAVAASGFFGVTGHNILGSEVTNVQAAQTEAMEMLGVAPVLPESFTNGFKFVSANASEFQSTDEEGNAFGEMYNMISATYKNDKTNERMEYIIDEYPWNADEMANSISRDYNAVTIYYNSYVHKMVPPNYKPTAEDEVRMAAGNFNLAYGSDEIEESVVQQVSWQADGMMYRMMGFDLSLTQDDLFAMVQEILAQ